jgi:addiction module HigA family antidote
MRPSLSRIFAFRWGIDWRSFSVAGLVSTAYGSTTNGVFVSSGETATLTKSRSRTITEERQLMAKRKMAPIHPGEILQEEFLKPLGISQYRLATDVSVPPRRINEIVHGKRGISADTAIRLARYFNTSDRFWLNLQSRYDLEVGKDRLGARLKREVAVFARAS